MTEAALIPGLLAGLFTIFLGGLGVALLALRGRAQVHVLEAGALSWFFGTGVVSLTLWAGGLILSGPALQALVALVTIALGGAGFVVARNGGARIYFPAPRNAVEWFLAGAIALQFAFLVYGAGATGLGWDGLLNWEIKARYAFLNQGVIPADYFSSMGREFTRPVYPLWIPFTELWLYLWMGEAHQFWVKILFPIFYASGAILLATLGTRLTGRRWIGLLTAALPFFVPVLTNSPGGALVGYVDLPISMLYLAAIGYLLLSGKCDPVAWRIAALCLALLPWAKREGAALWLVAALCGALTIWQTRRAWSALLWLLPGAVIALTWKAFCIALGTTPSQDFLPLNFATLRANLPRVGPIVRSVLSEMIETTHWSVFWPIVALAFLVLLFRSRDRRLAILLVAVVTPILVYSSTLLFSAWPDLTVQIVASLSRLLLHVMPVAWLAIALALRPPRASAEFASRSSSRLLK